MVAERGTIASWIVQMRDHHGFPYIENALKAILTRLPRSLFSKRIGRSIFRNVVVSPAILMNAKTSAASLMSKASSTSPNHMTQQEHFV
jgi:hypothetical protein